MVHEGDIRQACPVCSEDFSNTPFGRTALKNHYWKAHTEFPALTKREGKKLVILLTPALAVLTVLLVYLLPSSQDSALYVVVGYVAYSGLLAANMLSKARAYKRRWVEEHALPNDLV